MRMRLTQFDEQATARGSTGAEILAAPEELDLLTADELTEQSCAAIARRPRMLLLDLAGLSFCDARGLGAFVRIANQADAAGCRYGLIAPRPPIAKMLRIGDLSRRLPVFATIDDALADLAATAEPEPEDGQTAKPDDQGSPAPPVSLARPDRFLPAAHEPGEWSSGKRSA
jgi:anti-sigma B factor antagonist